MKHWTFKRKFCDSVFTPKKGAKVGNVKTSAKLVLFFLFGRLPTSPPPPTSPVVGVVLGRHHTNHSQPTSLLFLFSVRKIILY